MTLPRKPTPSSAPKKRPATKSSSAKTVSSGKAGTKSATGKTATKAKFAKAPARKAKVAAKTSVARTPVAKTPVAKVATEKSRVTKAKEVKALREASPRALPAQSTNEPEVLARILTSLDDDKAEDIVTIPLMGRSSLADAIVIATGRSSRHVASIADHLARRLKEAGYGTRPVDGAAQGDWVLVDAGDVIVHVFRPEVRDYYDLEGMWSVREPEHRPAR